MKPRIGVTSSPSLHEDRFLEALDRAYVSAVIRAGGLPFVLPVLDPEEVGTVLACLDGILFTGGGDLDPGRYAATASPRVQGLDPDRDAYEIALAKAALALGLPMLGICRGSQVLNVAFGGTLVQHLPDVSDLEHRAGDQWAEEVHTVRVLAGSRLRDVVGQDVVGVNSLHHQAVDRLGRGLEAVGWAADGTIEAVEGAGQNRVLGVQWHPELLLANVSHTALFDWLVREASRRVTGVAEGAAAGVDVAVADVAVAEMAVAEVAVAGPVGGEATGSVTTVVDVAPVAHVADVPAVPEVPAQVGQAGA